MRGALTLNYQRLRATLVVYVAAFQLAEIKRYDANGKLLSRDQTPRGVDQLQ
jgi:hypothetical protein